MNVLYLTIITVLVSILLAGCQPGLTPAQQQQVQQLVVQGKVDLQKQINANKIALENGRELPAYHPLAGTNQIVLELHPIAKWATIGLAGGAMAVWILGFIYSTITFLPKLAVALTKGAVLSLGVLIALNFIIWALAIMIGAFFVVWLIDSIKNHWDEGKTFQDILATVGIKMGQTPAAAIADAKLAVPPTANKSAIAVAMANSAAGAYTVTSPLQTAQVV